MDLVKEFPVKICHLLRVPIQNFQDPQDVTWHLLWCTGTELWRSTGCSRNDWVLVDSINRNSDRAVKGVYPAHLVSIMKVRDIKTGLVDRLVLLDNVIYRVPAQYPDTTHHGNHWNTKCIFYYLHN